MSRLVVVSNRVADFSAEEEACQGGLAMALGQALRARGGLWFGWSGEAAASQVSPPRSETFGDVTTARIDLDPGDIDEYYNGFANRTLWPLCHYRMDLAEYARAFGAGYQRVNHHFASSLAPLLREGDIVWVHDYHLIPLGAALRREGVRNRSGFFLHIPWPAREVFAALPRHQELVETLFEYDLVGFQANAWLNAFREYATSELGAQIGPNGNLSLAGQDMVARVYPIGLDVDEMRRLADSQSAEAAMSAVHDLDRNSQFLLGVDRIDYSKGLPQKFDAFRQFLANNPDRLGQISLLQIGQPSRTEVESYRSLGEDLQAQAGAINAQFGTLHWNPVFYRETSLGRDTLAGLYRAADVMLVTSLRDGMNLVAKEFVAAQDESDPGVLILSRFTGAAEQMREALLVNPYSREDISEAIKRAVEMPRSERIARWKSLDTGIRRYDVNNWRDRFLTDLIGEPRPCVSRPGVFSRGRYPEINADKPKIAARTEPAFGSSA